MKTTHAKFLPRFVACALIMFALSANATAPKVPSGSQPGTFVSPGPTTPNSTVQLSWIAVTGASYYQLGVRDLSNGQLVVGEPVKGSSSYTAKLVAGRAYRWNVNACNQKNECSAFTQVLYFQTPAPKPTMYSFLIRSTGSGSGSLSCDNGPCASSYPAGTKIRVAAIPATGSKFQSFTGCDSGSISGASCSVTFNQGKEINAAFSIITYGLQIKKTGTGIGSILCNGSVCADTYAAKTELTLLAVPETGSKFGAWTGCAALPANPLSCKLTIDAAKSIEAAFTKAPISSFELKFSPNGSGTVTCQSGGKSCSSGLKYVVGTEVTLTANPASGAVFDRWSNCPISSGTTCKVTVKSDLDIAAYFKADNVAINLVRTEFGSILLKGIGCEGSNCSTARRGTTIEATAVADAGYIFLQWTKCPSGQSNSKTCSFKADGTQPLDLKAMFARPLPTERIRMSETTKHYGVHAWLRLREDTQIDAWSQGIKERVIAKGVNEAFKQSIDKKRFAQLSAQVELSAKNYALDPDRALKNITNAINSLYKNGIVPHLVLSIHEIPKPNWPSDSVSLSAINTKWKAANPQDKNGLPTGDVSLFLPYQPCLDRLRSDGTVCPYDVIFEQFHTPVIKYLVDNGIADRIAVIYVFNEFDYPNLTSENTIPTKNWTTAICGVLGSVDCRARSLAYTTKRGLEKAVAAANGRVPVGLKFADIARRGDSSAWAAQFEGATSRTKDYLKELIQLTMMPRNMVVGYDCYSPWKDGARVGPYTPEKLYCEPDAIRFDAIVASSSDRTYLTRGKFEIAEYNRACEGRDLGEGLDSNVQLITKDQMVQFAKKFPSASGFNLFAFGAGGDKDGCYSLGYFSKGVGTTPEDDKTGPPVFYKKNGAAWQGLSEQMQNHIDNK